MTAIATATPVTVPTDVEIECRFLKLYVELQSRAKAIARSFKPRDREDVEAEVIASSWINFRQAARAGRWLNGTQLGWAACQFVRGNRSVGGFNSATDVTSPITHARQRANVVRITSLENQTARARVNRESLSRLEKDYVKAITLQDRDGPAVLTQMKLDWTALAKTLSSKHRRAIYRLARGERPGEVARRLGVSAGRVSQMIAELKRWVFNFFDGDVAVPL